jgi:hypothetical protein
MENQLKTLSDSLSSNLSNLSDGLSNNLTNELSLNEKINSQYELFGISLSGGSYIILFCGIVLLMVGIALGNRKLIFTGLITYPIGAYTNNCVSKGGCTYWSIFLVARIFITFLLFFFVFLSIIKEKK